MVRAAPLWSVLLVPAVLLVFSAAAVGGDALLAARDAGRRLSAAAAFGPWRELPRLLIAQPASTPAADSLLWRLGIITVPVAGVLAAVVVPFGSWTASDMAVGVVWFNAMEVLTWAGLWLAGWGPNAALPLIGGYRFIAQGLAYELPLMFALIAAATGAESLRLADIVAAQRPLWFVVEMPVAFAVYLISVLGFAFFGPFGYPAGADLAGGVLAAVGGVERLLLQGGRWLLLGAGAAMAVPLFLGGGLGPGLPPWMWSLVKTAAVLAGLVWTRRRVPTLRADRYLELAWVVLIPAGIAQALVAALLVLNR